MTAIVILGVAWAALAGYNYLSGKSLLKDLWHYGVLRSRSLEEWDRYHDAIEEQAEIVVSLTTIPERIESLDLVLKSLLYQTVKPQSINLYLPYRSFRNDEPYVVPDWLYALKNVTIHRVAKDFGPSTKSIPALRHFAEDQDILVVDDDNIYPSNYIAQFAEASQRNEGVILAASGWRVPDDLLDRPTTLWSNIRKEPPTPIPGTRVSEPYRVDVVQGYSGYLLKPAYFDLEALSDYSEAPEALRYVDDVWLSAHARVPKVVFPMKRYCYNPFFRRDTFRSSSLARINNWGRENYEDRNNSIGIRYFSDRWNRSNES